MDQKSNIKKARKQIALILGVSALIILLLVVCGLLVLRRLTAPCCPSSGAPGPILVVNLPLSSLDIITDTPSSMRVKTSYTIKVSLTPKGQTLISGLMIEMATPTASDTIPVGTPGASLKEAFGPGLEPVAMATLQADTFVISPVGPVEEPLDQSEVTWEWSVTPNESGTQFLAVDIEGYWRAAHGEARGPYRIGDKTFRVDVSAPTPVPTPTPTPEPFITPGHIDIGAIITSLPSILLGAGGLGVLLIVGLVSHLKRQDRKKKPPVPHSSRGRSSRKKPTH